MLATLALAVPLPALALSSEDPTSTGVPPAPVALSVSTALDSCGLAQNQIVCKLDVSFGQVPGATSYSAAVTRADGSVADYGSIGAGGASLWVPYVGPGAYSVRVTAYGSPPEADAGEGGSGNVIASGSADAEAKPDSNPGNASATQNPGARRGDKGAGGNATESEAPGNDAAETVTVSSSCDETTVPAPATPSEPAPELPPEDLDPNDADEDDDGVDDAEERLAYELALSEQQQAALEAQATLPDGVECATP
jgi:hypothetical protein